jgi:hypothetical protein
MILGAFAKLRKVASSFVVCVCVCACVWLSIPPSVRMEHLVISYSPNTRIILRAIHCTVLKCFLVTRDAVFVRLLFSGIMQNITLRLMTIINESRVPDM